LHCWMDLLTTYTHHSELHVISALSPITTATAKPFAAYCTFTSRSQATVSNSEDSSASELRPCHLRLPCRVQLTSCPTSLLYNSWARNTEKTPCFQQ
jgi:hypothetical protein